MFKNRKFTFVFLILAIALILVALPTVSQDDVPEGTIVFNSYNSDPEPRAWTEELVAMWNEQNPQAQVDLSTVEHESFKQAIRTYLVADPAPDVLTWFAGNRAQFFIDRDLILPISDMWEANNFDELYAPGFNALATVDGEQYFLPTSYYWWAIYYRPSIFEEVGLEAPIDTWDELLNACDVLNEAGYAPFTIGTKFRWTAAAWFDYINMRVNGPEFHRDLMLLRESYTDERVVETFNTYAQLFERNCFIEDPAAYTWQEALDFMIQGDAAMYLMGGFITDSYPDELEEDLDFFRFPVIVEGVPIGEDAPTDGFFIPAAAENPEGAKAFLAWLGSQEVRQMAFNERDELPPRTDVDLSNAPEPVQKGIELIQGADVVLQFYDRDTTPEMADAGMDMMMEFWNEPGDLMELLEELEEDRVRIAEEQASQE
jgi:multiple sugar transport system substrate-binding protein/raffinose/stachyose/melibiose transport system substrate-binding protein